MTRPTGRPGRRPKGRPGTHPTGPAGPRPKPGTILTLTLILTLLAVVVCAALT